MQRWSLIMALVLALAAPALTAEPEPSLDNGTIDIMRPETAPPAKDKKSHKTRGKLTHKRPRGSSNPVYPTPLPGPQAPLPVPHQEAVTPEGSKVPPPLYVPETGRLLPNLPATGAGPAGAETLPDRSLRCAHQAGVYGQAAGDPGSYIRGCINQ